MDPNKQDTLSIETSVYRTAFKLRSVQTLCQLDLIDSSLIQGVLLHQSFSVSRESSLSVQQLLQQLRELFQRARAGRPGQVHPRAAELTLSLLMAMYDRTGSGILNLLPVVAALVALSGDSPLTKYRALFQLYVENNRGGYDSRARMTRKDLRNLLADLQQIPTVVGESRTLCSVESAVCSCFRGVLSTGIKEEKFLSWAQSEPLILLWLPACHRLSATETVSHPVRCSVCRAFPITGLRYRCLKCLSFDICQVCFLSGLHTKSHQKSHTMTEHCVQMSAKENTKLLLRTLRNNLLERHCGREAMRRHWLLDQPTTKAGLFTQCSSPNVPLNVRPIGPVEAAITESSRPVCQRISHTQQVNESHPHHQTIVGIKKELWRTRESINALHRERRILQKQLKQYKERLQALHASQEEKTCKFETKIQELTTNQDSLQTKLQQMGQDFQAMLKPPCPSPSSQNMESVAGHLSAGRLWRGDHSLHIKSVIGDGGEREPLPNSAGVDRNHRSQASAQQTLPNSEPQETILQSSRAQSHAQKMLKETYSSLPSSQETLMPENPHISPAEMLDPSWDPEERKETIHILEQKDEPQEEELQELLSNLLDAFNLETPSGCIGLFNILTAGEQEEASSSAPAWFLSDLQPKHMESSTIGSYYLVLGLEPEKTRRKSPQPSDVHEGARRVCKAFSALVDQITLPHLK